MTSAAPKIQLCQTPEHQQVWLDLRWQVLRAPWRESVTRTDDEAALPSGQRALILDQAGQALACGQLSWPHRGVAQIRNMAVSPSVQGQGYGRAMLDGLRRWAQLRGADKLIAMARDSSLGFYRCAGFEVTTVGPELFDCIPHHWVEKALPATDFAQFGLTFRAVNNQDSEALMGFIFRVLGAYGLQPEHEGIDQDLIAPEHSYQGGMFLLLCDQQQQIVGTVALLPREAGLVELRRMYLDPALRGRGLGRACLGLAMRKARELGFTRMSLETAHVLKEAVALYQAAGFKACEGPLHARRCDLYMTLDDF